MIADVVAFTAGRFSKPHHLDVAEYVALAGEILHTVLDQVFCGPWLTRHLVCLPVLSAQS